MTATCSACRRDDRVNCPHEPGGLVYEIDGVPVGNITHREYYMLRRQTNIYFWKKRIRRLYAGDMTSVNDSEIPPRGHLPAKYPHLF